MSHFLSAPFNASLQTADLCVFTAYPIRFQQIEALSFDGPFNTEKSPEADKQRTQTMDMLTSAVLLASKTQDDELFKSSVAQLRVMYADYANVVDSEKKCNVMGLILLRLLADDELAAFNCELETLSAEEIASAPVTFATSLAQSLAEGSYHHVVSAKPPSAPFAAFMPKITDAVRVDIANCSEKAYASLSIADAQRHMFFDSEQVLLSFIEDHERNWQVQDGRVYFGEANTTKTMVPSKLLISQSLSYANELERIV